VHDAFQHIIEYKYTLLCWIHKFKFWRYVLGYFDLITRWCIFWLEIHTTLPIQYCVAWSIVIGCHCKVFPTIVCWYQTFWLGWGKITVNYISTVSLVWLGSYKKNGIQRITLVQAEVVTISTCTVQFKFCQ